jgi:predicted nucleic acid-binding protein
MKVLLDTNVILDLMLEREPWHSEAEALAHSDADGRLVLTPGQLLALLAKAGDA